MILLHWYCEYSFYVLTPSFFINASFVFLCVGKKVYILSECWASAANKSIISEPYPLPRGGHVGAERHVEPSELRWADWWVSAMIRFLGWRLKLKAHLKMTFPRLAPWVKPRSGSSWPCQTLVPLSPAKTYPTIINIGFAKKSQPTSKCTPCKILSHWESCDSRH